VQEGVHLCVAKHRIRPIMTEKFKKIERQYVLSDSTVNEYGFRLLTSGYELATYQKNPIGYYMHRREEGIVLKWEDLQIEGDTVVGTPVINLANDRGEQTCYEAENGFLNAASVGHIVVLEYSTDPAQMLPGQTGPTITRWYNKECSLVDIPGNCNALTRLYDAQENELNLADFSPKRPIALPLPATMLQALCDTLQLAGDLNEHNVLERAANLVAQHAAVANDNKVLTEERNALVQELSAMHAQRTQEAVTQILNRALEDRKITVALRTRLEGDYANNPDGLKELEAAMPAYRSILEHLKSAPQDPAETQWQWDDYEKNDPTGKKLKELRANDPERYKELFEKKFNTPTP
jgi:hypothetical protein